MNDKQRPPFDETAALEALDRLREEIRAVRSRRESKVEEFEAWIRATRNASTAERLAELDASAETLHADAETIVQPPGGATRDPDAAPQPRLTPIAAAPAPLWPYEDAPTPRDRDPWTSIESEAPRRAVLDLRDSFNRARLPYLAGAALLAIAAVMFLRSDSDDATGAPVSESATAPAESAPRPASGAPGAAPGAAATQGTAEPRALEIELTTLRPVWMRVIVDGERRVEREVPANERLTFGADRSILVRAGDGGGVRVRIDGQDRGVLGRDGQIAVRTFTPR